MTRFLFALIKTWQYKEQLREFVANKNLHFSSVTKISKDFLKRENITSLILDFDGVLSCHGQNIPLVQVQNWLNDIISFYPDLQIYILSNKPTFSRKAYFARQYPKIKFISSVYKKPYPDGIFACKSELASTAIVDDRLLTGILAALIAKIKPIYITSPWVSTDQNKIVEGFFKLLRKLEIKIFS